MRLKERGAYRQSFLQGAAILAGATVAVKLVGACFKIPLANLLGGMGMGDFTIAYDIFRPVSALAVAGLPVAVSKMVSENAALGRWRDARRILRLAAALFFVSGLAGSAVMFLGAERFAGLLGSPQSGAAIAALSPAVLFCCLMSAWRGYYQGLGNMLPTAVSQVTEAGVKLVCGILLCAAFMQPAMENWPPLAGLPAPARGAVGAVLGVAASTAAGTLFLSIRHLLRGDGLTRRQLSDSPPPARCGALLRRMGRIAVPVCLGSVVAHLTGMIDLASILTRLDAALGRDAPAFLGQYAGLIPADYPVRDIPKFLYGSYSGIALNIFNLVPSLTAALGVSVLPALSGAWAVGDRRLTGRHINTMLRVTMLLAAPAGLGLTVLAGPLCQLLYGRKPVEAALAAGLLRMLGPAAILVALTAPLNAALQAVGRTSAPVKLMALGGALKFAANYLFIGLPQVNIAGAPAGTLLCYALIVPWSLRLLVHEAKVRINYGRAVLRPLAAGILCAAGAWSAHGLLARILPPGTAALLAVGIGAGVYLAAALLLQAVTKDDVLMLPKGEKIAKILEKHALIR